MTAFLRKALWLLALLGIAPSAYADVGNACMNAVGIGAISKEIEELIKADERRKQLPQEVVERWFRGCSFDQIKEKLASAGFNVGEYDKIPIWQAKQGIKRIADGEKKLSTIFVPGTAVPIGAHLLRVTVFDHGDRLDIQTLVYADTP